MNDKILEFALSSGLLNYVDNETPRRYFINGNADLEEVEAFARRIISECAYALVDNELYNRHIGHAFREHFDLDIYFDR